MAKKQNQAYDTCGAKTRAGTPCKRPAGWGTSHPGVGRCKLHGGASTGPKNQKENKNAEKHGLFSKYLPQETNELLEEIESISTLDILWQNIKIQFAAIIRAQKIMYVKGQEDLTRIEKRKKQAQSGGGKAIELEYEIQTAWDKQERFLTSQARAMTNLTNMIVKYENLCKSDLATEEQRTRIEKLKAETEKTKREMASSVDTEEQLKKYFDTLKEVVQNERP